MIVPPMRRFGEAPVMLAIRDALPWSLVGLAAGVLLFFLGARGALLTRYAAAIIPGFGLMSLVLAGVLPYKLACRYRVRPWFIVPLVFAAFFISGPLHASSFADYARSIGASGLFVAIVLTLLCAGLFTVVSHFRGPAILRARGEAMAPFLVVVVCIVLATLHFSLGNVVMYLLHPLGHLGDTLAALLIITAIETLLWTAGVHGPATLAGIVTPVYLLLQQENTAAYSAHQPLPHIVVVSIFLFIFPGGAGATLPVAALLAISKNERLRKIARATLLPSIFNINEPLLFGLPIVFNPFLAVPFVVVPCILAVITYAAVYFGIVGRPIFYYPSSIPSVISTYLATLDWRAVVLVIVNIAIAAALYFPFVRAYERHEGAKT